MILYPQSYRREYEDEMVETMQIMLGQASSATAKWKLFWLACHDYIFSLTRQNVAAFETAATKTPDYIVQSSKFSTSLVMPFILICTYNSFCQYFLHRGIPYQKLESKTWIIYCVVLPALSLLILFVAAARNLLEITMYNQKRQVSWLMLSLPAMLLITLALL